MNNILLLFFFGKLHDIVLINYASKLNNISKTTDKSKLYITEQKYMNPSFKSGIHKQIYICELTFVN